MNGSKQKNSLLQSTHFRVCVLNNWIFRIKYIFLISPLHAAIEPFEKSIFLQSFAVAFSTVKEWQLPSLDPGTRILKGSLLKLEGFWKSDVFKFHFRM